MRKMIVMAVAGFLWRKLRARMLPGQRAARGVRRMRP